MKEAQALKLMADIGPNAKDAVESWVELQWYEFWVAVSFEGVAFLLILAIVFVFWKKSND